MSKVNGYFEGFDEARYLRANPDVLEALKAGAISSGWRHYVLSGIREHRPGVDPEVGNKVKSILDALERNAPEAAPPAHLRKRVHGSTDVSSFEHIGKMVSFDIYNAIRSASVEISPNARILDLGCGCGRIIRYFHKLYVEGKFYGTDIDREAIAWCEDNLSYIGSFVQNGKLPPLPFEDRFFDFVYSISIFTHLPEAMQFRWLEELRRVTKQGAYVLLTTHGPEVLPERAKRERDKLMRSGFYYKWGRGTGGLPLFYQTAFHTEDYIARRWGNVLEVSQIIKKGINDRQDLVLCRSR
jgi:ubiquinone/menaquinone biosynthesis C-methylase UbiE